MKTTFRAVRTRGFKPGQRFVLSDFNDSTSAFRFSRIVRRLFVWYAALCFFGQNQNGSAAPRGPGTAGAPRFDIRVSGPDLTLSYSSLPSPGLMTIFQTDRLTTPLSDWTPVHTAPIKAWASGSVVLSNHVGPAVLFFRLQVSTMQVPDHMIWIAPGTFLMGSPAWEPDRLTNEGPQHPVTITQGFWLAKYEVTQAEYSVLMHANPSVYQGDPRCPVDSVSWEEATN